MDPEDCVEAVLALVERVPPSRVTTSGALADEVGFGGPRRVGRVMSQLRWARALVARRTRGRDLPLSHDDEARARYLDEGTPLRPSGRIDMPRAFWQPR